MNHNAKQTTKRRRYVHAPKWQAFRNKTWRFWTTRTARPSQVFPEELICSNIPIHRLNPKERNFSKKTPTLKKKYRHQSCPTFSHAWLSVHYHAKEPWHPAGKKPKFLWQSFLHMHPTGVGTKSPEMSSIWSTDFFKIAESELGPKTRDSLPRRRSQVACFLFEERISNVANDICYLTSKTMQ